MSSNYDAVIFDLDGTLLDTLDDLGDATNLVLRRFGFPQHPIDAYRQMVGQGLRVLMEKALPAGQQENGVAGEAVALLDTYLMEHPATKTHLYPQVSEMLSALEAAHVPMGILTNKPDNLAQVVVRQLLGRWTFGGAYGQRDGVPRKPDPTAAIALSRELGSLPSRTLFVGDSDVDMKTGVAAEMTPIGVKWGFRDSEELRAAGAELIISHPMELLNLVDAG